MKGIIIYCRPDANSLTAQRARDGEAKLRQEVCDLCDIIFNLGVTTGGGRSKIQFGELFQVNMTREMMLNKHCA